MAEYLTFNQGVVGSSPTGVILEMKGKTMQEIDNIRIFNGKDCQIVVCTEEQCSTLKLYAPWAFTTHEALTASHNWLQKNAGCDEFKWRPDDATRKNAVNEISNNTGISENLISNALCIFDQD